MSKEAKTKEEKPVIFLTREEVDGKKLEPKDFVHLHNHTHYSLLDGLTKIPDLVNYVKEQGMEAVAVTDHGTMSGLVELYKEADAAGIHPVLGCEAYVAARKRTDKDPAYDKERYHITLLAMNDKGFENLCRLASEAEITGMYYKPRIDHEIMEKYNEGIICLSGCMSSEISVSLINDDYEKALELAKWYRGVYGDRFYLEMQDHGHPKSPTHSDVQNKVNKGLQKLHDETGIPLVITCDGHYLKHEDQDAHEVLLCIGTASNLSDTNRMTLRDYQLHVIPPAELIERWKDEFPEAVKNTKIIADRCTTKLDLGRILIPKFDVPEGYTEKSYLDELVFQGLVFRYAGKTQEEAKKMSVEECRKILPKNVLERIDYELSVVDKMGYNGYFLIVQDFINWGKNQGIVYGPGRGSAAGAILAYALRITELDPLKYDLLFERFLNPDRISMPDIDTDIQDTRRDEVIEYCTEKYGKGRVSNICTFGKMMGKMAVRDVARVLEMPYADADRLAKMVPDPEMGHHVPLAKAIVEAPDLRREYETNPAAKEVLDYAIKLEGTVRSHGVHACGVVIAPDDLVKFLPLEVAKKTGAKGEQIIATQFPSTQVEELGLLKMDFLGLMNLSVMNNCLRMVRKVYKEDVDLYSIPLDDEKTYELFQKAQTTGVFQLESGGMKKYLKDLKASSFEDIIAMVALYRPGPMQFIDSFIRRKHGEEPITYLHPGLENALKSTYGIMIYQEQFMQISREWCGFTGGESDTLRKAVGKKKVKLMEELKPKFIKGAVEIGGATEEIAEEFWKQLLEFANYCFNKSHAACYALIAYWTAYLKAHYPDAFMAALMTSDMGDTDRLAIEMSECKSMGIDVLGPDINQSYADFAIVGGENKIRFGLSAIKGVGKSLIEDIVIPERDANGPFRSVCDFAARVDSTKFNKKSWESVIKTGGFDSFGAHRSDLLFNLEQIQAYGSKLQKDKKNGQTDLFGLMGDAGIVPEPEMKEAPTKASEKEQLLWERDLMGLYLSAHPLDKYDTYFNEQTHPFSYVSKDYVDRLVTLGGIITSIKNVVTKAKGEKMAIVTMENKTGSVEFPIFPKLYNDISDIIVVDNIIKVTGTIDDRDREGNHSNDIKILPKEIVPITDEMLNNYKSTGEKIDEPAEAPKRRNYKPKPIVEKTEEEKKKEEEAVFAVKPKAIDPRDHKLYILIEDPEDTEKLTNIKKACDRYPGLSPVVLVLKDGDEKRAMMMNFKVEAGEELIAKIKGIVGEKAVVLK